MSGILKWKGKSKQSGMNQGMKKCPICGRDLKKGERIFTEAFPGKKKEKIVYLHGCPYCNKKKSKEKRGCPVCMRVLPLNGYLIGKMWSREGKMRVHISCCSICGRKGAIQQ